jgi:hypothetical protein
MFQPNPQMERYDALISETCTDVNMIRHFDTTEDISYDDRFNAITFIDPNTLVSAFEYDYSRDPANSNLIVRGHPGRIYGSGCYDDARKEAKYQAFIHDAPRVAVAIEAMERFNAERAVNPNQHRLCSFDSLQSDYNPAFQDDIVQYWEESYPYDLQDEIIEDPRKSPSYVELPAPFERVSGTLNNEPFIRAPVISRTAEEFMETEFYEPYWEQQAQEDEDRDSYIDWDVEEPDDYDW